MGKHILGAIVVVVVLVGVFVFGYSAGVTMQGGRVCEADRSGQAQERVCIVDGVRYVPEGSDG